MRHEILTLNLTNLENVEKVEYYLEKSNFVYCFENPSMFYAVTRQLPWIAAICTSGQINLAAYILMDALVKSNYKLLYCGDFDPEGLLIADKLRKRYRQSIEFVGYTKTLYQKAISNNILSQNRIKQLERLSSKDFEEVSQEILLNKKAGYQEHIIDEIIDIIRTQKPSPMTDT